MRFRSGEPLDSTLDQSAHVAFTRVWLREGYTRGQVDAFIDEAVRALTRPTPSMRPEDVRAVRFTPVRMRGYDMREVDAYLDDLEHHLVAREQDPQHEHEPWPPVVTARKPGPALVWAARLRWALMLLVVVLWVYADMFQRS